MAGNLVHTKMSPSASPEVWVYMPTVPVTSAEAIRVGSQPGPPRGRQAGYSLLFEIAMTFASSEATKFSKLSSDDGSR